MKKLILATLALVMAGSSALVMADSAAAYPRRQGIQQREVNQQRRIYRGVRSGALTFREANRLERRQGRIHRQKSRFLADGSLSGRERRVLRNHLNRSSRNIYRLKHNHRHD